MAGAGPARRGSDLTWCSTSARGRPPTLRCRRDELIAYGPQLSDNGATRLGTAALVRRPDKRTRHASGPGHGTRHPDPGPVRRPWVHNWQFGRRS